MKNARQVLWGIIIALITIVIILGAILLSQVEANTGSKPATASPTTQVKTAPPITASPTPTTQASPTSVPPTSTSSAATAVPATSTATKTLPTSTPSECGQPKGWVAYYIHQGDTLYRLSLAYGVTVSQLQQANCMGQSTLLMTGHTLFVPPWATLTPMFPIATDTETPTAIIVPTSLP